MWESKGLSPTALLNDLERMPDRPMSKMFGWLRKEYFLDIEPVSSVPKGVITFLGCLSTTSPVSSYLHPSSSNVKLVRSLTREDIKCDPVKYRELERDLPILYGLLRDLKGFNRIPEVFSPVLSYLINQAESPFNPENILPVLKSSPDQRLQWYVFLF